MLHELGITVTMRLVALGHSLAEAQELAALIVLQLVLLCTLLGYRVVLPEEIRPLYPAVIVPACCVLGIRGILLVRTGTAGRPSAALLHS
jgi:hypothetical protein